MQQSLGEIREERKGMEPGFTQQYIADMIGVTKETVVKWELYRSTPLRKYWPKIMEVYGVDENYLMEHGNVFLAKKDGDVSQRMSDSPGGVQAGRDATVSTSCADKLTKLEREFIALNREFGNDNMLREDIRARKEIKKIVERRQL